MVELNTSIIKTKIVTFLGDPNEVWIETKLEPIFQRNAPKLVLEWERFKTLKSISIY